MMNATQVYDLLAKAHREKYEDIDDWIETTLVEIFEEEVFGPEMSVRITIGELLKRGWDTHGFIKEMTDRGFYVEFHEEGGTFKIVVEAP